MSSANDADESRIYTFGDYDLDESTGELRRNGERIPLRRQSFLLLAYLLRRRPCVVSNAELLREVWRGTHVSFGAIRDAVLGARKALTGTECPRIPWIETAPGIGYRFGGEARERRCTRPGAAAPAPGRVRAASESRFIDREVEMEALREACQAALRGERRVVLIQGPPGVGKTRLAAELASEASGLGCEVHRGQTHEGSGARPLWPWIQILRSWVDAHGREALELLAGPRGVAVLAGLLEDRAEAEDPVRSHTGSEHSLHFALLDQLRHFLRAASEQLPLVLVLEGLHQADSASLELLIFATKHLARARLLVLVTHRAIDPGHALGRVLREPGTQSIALSGLARQAVEDVIAQALGRKPDAETVEGIFQASGGNPLFVSELSRALERGAWSPCSAGSQRIPAQLHDAVWARISECSESCRELLKVACLMGPERTLPVLRGALGMDDAAVLKALAEAEQRDLLIASSQGHRFVHGVVRDSLLERMGTTERMELHRRIGLALEACAGADPTRYLSELAHHFTECAALSCAHRAAFFARRAAAAARRAFAYREAAELYRSALRSLDLLERPDPEWRVFLLVELGDVLAWAGAPAQEFQGVLLQAIEHSREAGLTRWIAEAAQLCTGLLMGSHHLTRVLRADPDIRPDRLRVVLLQVYRSPEVTSDPVLHTKVLIALQLLTARNGDLELAEELLEAALARARSSKDAMSQLDMLLYPAFWRRTSTRAERIALSAEVLEQTGRSGDPPFDARAQAPQVWMALELGDRDALDRSVRAAGELAADLGHPLTEYWFALLQALQAQLDGPVERAVSRAQDAARVGGRSPIRLHAVSATLNASLSWLALLGGHAVRLLPSAEDALKKLANQPAVHIGMARLYAELAMSEDARRELRGLHAHLKDLSGNLEELLFFAGVAADAAVRVRDRESGELLWEILHPHADRVLTAGGVAVCMGSVARSLAGLAALRGCHDESDELFTRAAAHARSLRAPVLSVVVDADRAFALESRPCAAERRRAAQIRTSALHAARELGLEGIARRLASREARRAASSV